VYTHLLPEPPSVADAPLDSARQPERSALVLSEPASYHFRTLDPRLPLRSNNRRQGVILLPLSHKDCLHMYGSQIGLGLNSTLSPSTVISADLGDESL
jgi:hypothetical protein